MRESTPIKKSGLSESRYGLSGMKTAEKSAYESPFTKSMYKSPIA